MDKLEAEFKFVPYKNYLTDTPHNVLELISLGPPKERPKFILHNTVLLAVCKNKGRPFCNIVLKHYLDKKNIVVSIGSACNTSAHGSSHVLQSIEAPNVVKRGVVRVSFGDITTEEEINEFIKYFIAGVKYQCKDVAKYIKAESDLADQ